MARFRLRAVPWIVGGTGHTTITGGLQVRATKALGSVLLGGSGRAIIGGGFSYNVPPPVGDTWTVPNQTFLQGSNQTYDLKQGVPSSYASGGLFSTDVTGTPLPSGMTLTDDGILGVGSATATSVSNVKLGYSEPNAWPMLTLHPALTAVLPYMATVFPCEGAVPSGRFFVSPNDTNLRSSTLSTWPDGSAQIMVVAGNVQVDAGLQKSINLRLNKATDAAGTALTVAAITSKFTTGITVDFGSGSANLNTWTAPDRIWWANSQVICARYRLAIPGKGVMEAVIDVHAFADSRAFVEVVIENCAVNATGTATLPSSQTYTNATVSVNGTQIQGGSGVSSPTNGQTFAAPLDGSGTMTWGSTAHEGLRAWYCSGWIGGDPQIEVTHDTASMQAHPMFVKIPSASSYNLQANYGADAYTPFSHQRHAPYNMGGTGDNKWIGHFPQWETRYLQSGSVYARRATIASALGVLTFAINYRDTTTRLVPSFSQIGSKSRNASTWPQASNGGSDPAVWEVGHQPAAGLVAFLCRPSPCFIEIAQKVAVWSSSWTTPTSFMSKFYQTRGRAWAYRNLVHAGFITPTINADSNVPAWRTAVASKIAIDIQAFDQFRTAANNLLEVIVDGDVGAYLDHCPNSGESSEGVGFQNSLWQHWLATLVLHHAHNSKLLSGANQIALGVLADWAGNSIVRYINELTGDKWKYIRHMTTCGQQNYNSSNGSAWGGGLYSGSTMSSLSTWEAMDSWWMLDAVVPTSNWKTSGNSTGTQRTYGSSWSTDTVAGTSLNYVSWFWAGLVAAVERDIPGATAAWTKVNTLTGLSTWLSGGASDPRQIFYPRNK